MACARLEDFCCRIARGSQRRPDRGRGGRRALRGFPPGWATEVLTLQDFVLTLEDRQDYRVVRTPHVQDFHWSTNVRR